MSRQLRSKLLERCFVTFFLQEDNFQISGEVNCSKAHVSCQKSAVKFQRSFEKTKEGERGKMGKLLRNSDTE